MKKILTLSVVAALIMAGCGKSKENTAPAPTPEAKPSASFKIANASDNNLLELRTLVFQNTSTNAVSYSWDLSTGANFSDGVVDQPMRYSDKAEPVNIYMIPCMQEVTITLTAKNKSGDVSTASQTFNVQCFRGVGGRHSIQHKLY
ncbi:MAG: hypothetical protein V9F01_08320 [Chitinophagaceae bacterium]